MERQAAFLFAKPAQWYIKWSVKAVPLNNLATAQILSDRSCVCVCVCLSLAVALMKANQHRARLTGVGDDRF